MSPKDKLTKRSVGKVDVHVWYHDNHSSVTWYHTETRYSLQWIDGWTWWISWTVLINRWHIATAIQKNKNIILTNYHFCNFRLRNSDPMGGAWLIHIFDGCHNFMFVFAHQIGMTLWYNVIFCEFKNNLWSANAVQHDIYYMVWLAIQAFLENDPTLFTSNSMLHKCILVVSPVMCVSIYTHFRATITVLCHVVHPWEQVHGANMGPIWGRQDPDGPRVGPMNFAIWDSLQRT